MTTAISPPPQCSRAFRGGSRVTFALLALTTALGVDAFAVRPPRLASARQPTRVFSGGEEAKEYDVQLSRPLGITIKTSDETGDRVFVTRVQGNAEAAGISVGDELIGVASLFGDAVWALPTGGNVIEGVKRQIKLCEAEILPLRLRKGTNEMPKGLDEDDVDIDERAQRRATRRVARILDGMDNDFEPDGMEALAGDADDETAPAMVSAKSTNGLAALYPEFSDPELLEDEWCERRQ